MNTPNIYPTLRWLLDRAEGEDWPLKQYQTAVVRMMEGALEQGVEIAPASVVLTTMTAVIDRARGGMTQLPPRALLNDCLYEYLFALTALASSLRSATAATAST